jgi:hypothetical protein
MSMIRLTHHFTTRQVRELRAVADRLGMTIAEIIRRAVDDWLKRNRGT